MAFYRVGERVRRADQKANAPIDASNQQGKLIEFPVRMERTEKLFDNERCELLSEGTGFELQ